MRGRSTREGRLTNRSFEWKKRELIVDCSQADADDNKKIYRLTSIEKTVGQCQVFWQFTLRVTENFEGLTKKRMLQRPNARSKRRRQKIDKGVKVSQQHW